MMRIGPAGGGVGHGAHCAHTRPTGRGSGGRPWCEFSFPPLSRNPWSRAAPPPGAVAPTQAPHDDRDGDALRAFRGVRVWSPFRRGTGLHTRDGRAGHTALRTHATRAPVSVHCGDTDSECPAGRYKVNVTEVLQLGIVL